MPEGGGRFAGADLGEALGSLGSRLRFAEPGDLAASVTVRLESEAQSAGATERLRARRSLRPVWRPVWLEVAAVLVALVVLTSAVLALSPGARRAVAGWLGLRGVKITVVPSLSPPPVRTLGNGLDLGERVTLAEARARAPFDVLVPTDPALGQPDEVYLQRFYGQPQVFLVYGPRPGIPVAATTGAGLLISEFEAGIDEQMFKKLVAGGANIESVTVNGGRGFWISGTPHEVYASDEFGNALPDTVRLAGNVLLWEQGTRTIRIEGDISQQQALRIAASMR